MIKLTLITNILGCIHIFSQYHSQNYQISKKNMSSEKNILISEVTLQAREEKNLPSGGQSIPNKEIGFASVFLRLENTQESNVNLIVKNIEIRNTSDEKIQIKKTSPQKINLKPLENSEEVFHLTNKTGYSEKNRVKAVITYQIGEKSQKIESKPIEIERF